MARLTTAFAAVTAAAFAGPSLSVFAEPQAIDPIREWSDGKAELAGYSLDQPRYGQLRSGAAVLITVKETFSESARVKADPGQHPPEDEFPVVKLNAVKDFQTGIYDYNLMTSAFAQLVPRKARRAGALTKVVFSSQEWCGALFDEILFDEQTFRRNRMSYFDGEGDQRETSPSPADGVTIDEMPLLVRRIVAPPLAPGESKALPILPSLERSRLVHKPLAWQRGRLTRSKEHTTIEVPAGRFEVETWTADLGGGETYSYFVETAWPHRLIEWRGPEGERGRLRGVARLKYWELQREGHEKHLDALGLKKPAY